MSPTLILSFVFGYFFLLLLISWFTGKQDDNQSFFTANRNAPWYLVAFGMIGASLSGVTFISIPGKVGASNWAYLQVVYGYLLGYLVIGTILLPLYYRMQLTSIYAYLGKRFGIYSYKTGSFFFLISRVIGASFRLYLVAMILQVFVFTPWGVPFWVSVCVTILLIWAYTFRGGIKTIVWTDTLQTLFMLLAVIFSIQFISSHLELGIADIWNSISKSGYNSTFIWDANAWNFFPKHFLGGAFIAIAMTGLDQDMMQKNLSCRNIKDAQKNMLWFTICLFFVNLVFLALGALLYIYAIREGISIPADSDHMFPELAIRYFTPLAGTVFLIGLIAAAYSSADSALTALTTSFCIDFLGFDQKDARSSKRLRQRVHIGFSVVLLLVILAFEQIKDRALIDQLFIAATYTYGPLLGLFSFGIFIKRKLMEKYVPFICILSPVLCYFLKKYSAEFLGQYQFGYEMLILNGLLTFAGLWLISKKALDDNIIHPTVHTKS